MAYLPTNSTNTLLLANQEFIGEAVAVDKEYISVTCSFNSNVGGVLEFFHSIDGFAFSNYADIYDFTDKAGSHSIEVSVKGKYFKIRYINGNQNQGVFNLFCKLNVTVGEAILNATYDTITVYAGGNDGFNIRELTTDDKVSVPRLEQVLTSDSGVSALQCKITSMPAIVIPPITIGDVNIRDSNGNDIISTTAGFLKTEIMNSSLTVNTISGYATSANQVTAQASLTSLVTGTRIQASNGNLITCDASNNLNVKELNSTSILSGITGIQNQLTTIHDDIVGLTHINTNTIIDNVVSVTGDFYPSVQSITGHVVVDNVLSVTGDFYPSLQSITGHVIVDNIVSITGHIDTGLTSLFISNPSLNVSLDCDTIVLTETADIAEKTALVTASSIYAYSADGGGIVENITFSNPSYLNNESAKNRLDVSSVLVDATNDLKIQIAPINSVLLNGTNGLICGSVLMGTKESDESARLLMTDDSILRVHTGLTSLFISNEIIAVTGDFYPSVQSVTGHVTVDNIVSVTGDFYPSIQSITGHVSIDNLVSVTGDFYPSVQSVTGHVTVDNIVSVGITGTPNVNISNTTLDVVVDAASSSILIYGAYNGTGTGIQTNSSGNLDIVGSVDANCSGTIESKTLSGDGLAITATGVSSHVGLDVYVINNSLKIEPGATFASSNTFKNSVYDSTGTAITSSIPITGKNSLDTSSILYGKSGASSVAPITTTLNATRQELDVNLEKTDCHLYAKKPVAGNNPMEILNSDNHNHLAVRLTNDDESKYNTFDTDGGVNVHITNTSLPITVGITSLNIKDTVGNTITSLTTPSNCVGALKTALYGTVTNNVIGDTAASPHGTTKTGLNNFIVNSYTLPVICGGYDGTNTQGFKTTTGGSQIVAFDTANNMIGITSAFNTIKIDTSNNTIKIDNANNTVQFSQTLNQNNIKITDVGGDIATISTPYLPSGVSSIRGLDTQACVNALDIYNNIYDNVTMTPAASGPNAGYKALDTYVRNPLTTVDKTLFGGSGTTTGINTYSQPIKQKQLVMSGNTSTANGILGGLGSTQTISNVDWGITKPKTFYISMTAGGTAKTFYYDYIDTNGNERTMNYTIPSPISNWYALPLQTGFTEQMVGINNVRVSTSLTINDNYYISNTQSTANTVCSGQYGRTFNAVITIPNNAIGYVSNVFMFNGTASNFNLFKYDAITGARKNIYYYNTAFATNHMASGYEGALGGILQAGEAVLGGQENANNMVVFANVVIKYLS